MKFFYNCNLLIFEIKLIGFLLEVKFYTIYLSMQKNKKEKIVFFKNEIRAVIYL